MRLTFRLPRRARPAATPGRTGLLDRRGASSLEFALVAIPLFVLILAGLELARYAATVASLRAVTDDAVRAATLTGYANLNANRAACTSLGAGTTLSPNTSLNYMVKWDRLTLTINTCTTNGPITTVGLTARYNHTFLFSALSQYSGTIVETATASFN